MPSRDDNPRPAGLKETAHAFPTLNGVVHDRLREKDEGRGSFKPLYQSPAEAQHGPDSPGQSQESEAQIRKKAFQSGFTDGRQDACRLTQQQIGPDLGEFASEFAQLSDYLNRLEEKSCQDVIKMAMSIAEKVLGEGPRIERADLALLNDELKSRMNESYRIKLALSREDFDILSRFMDCQAPGWRQCPSINIANDSSVKRGYIKTAPTADVNLPVTNIVRSLEEKLGRPSTK